MKVEVKTSASSRPSGTPVQNLPGVAEKPPAEGWTVEEAKGLLARDGLKAHFGEKVQYNPKGGGTWRIFYYDNENDGNRNGYFGALNTLYLKRDYVSNTTLEGHQTHIPSDNGDIMKKMNPKWAAAENGKEIDLLNEHCVSWLCDPEVWNEDYKVEGVADYAIGSPSVEMYMKAFNLYKYDSTALICKVVSENGYSVGANNQYTNSGHNTNSYVIDAGPNSIFIGSYDLWLASPSSCVSNYIVTVQKVYTRVDKGGYNYKRDASPVVAISQ